MGIRALIVGDPHLQVQKLEDGRKFIERLYDVAIQHEMVILLGDLFHNFAVVRSEVLSLWNEAFNQLAKKTAVVALVGNHDYCGQSGGNHALEVFKGRINVVDQMACFNGIYWMPFYRDNDRFQEQARALPPQAMLFCHQSFMGAHFENGFQDPHGADPKCVAHLGGVISGHIHARQMVQNIWYPGTPFQHTFAEAGQQKRVFTVHLSQTGYTLLKEHDLKMPRFEVIAPSDEGGSFSERLLAALPEPEPEVHYKIVGKATPLEIAEFWQNPRAKEFRSKTRRVVDAMIPDRGVVDLPGAQGKNRKDQLDEFIRSKTWRTDSASLFRAAAALLFEP